LKNLTGHDDIPINPKGKSMYSARLNAKILVSTNYIPNLDTTKSYQKSRILFFEGIRLSDQEKYEFLKENNQLDEYQLTATPYEAMSAHPWQEKMIAELDSYIAKCYIDYMKLCPFGGNIITPESMYSAIEFIQTHDTEEDVMGFVMENILAFDKDAQVEVLFFNSALLRKLIELLPHTPRGFARYMQKYLIEKGCRKDKFYLPNGSRPYFICGVKIRPNCSWIKSTNELNITLIKDKA